MKYPWFEGIVLALGSVAVVGSMFVGAGPAPQSAEVVAQLLIILVLAGALHWGRNGGFIAALVATAVYVGLRMPLLNAAGLTTDALILIGIRVLTYAVVGIVGGEIAGRVKYLLARLEDTAMIDSCTGAYSACHASKVITSGLGAWDRYQTPFSVIVLRVRPMVWKSLRPARARALMRQIASALRNDVRMVDDVAFRTDGEFLVLLPSTDHDGASVASDRLGAMVRDMLGTNESEVTCEVLSCSSDAARLATLARELAPESADAGPGRRASDLSASASVATSQEPTA